MTDHISREALLQTLDEVIKRTEETYPITPDQVYELRGEINATKAIWVLVNRFDAADVAPVVHGKWIGDCKAISDADGIARCGMYGFRCSKCNGFSIEDGRYCPRCGAKMDGGADD